MLTLVRNDGGGVVSARLIVCTLALLVGLVAAPVLEAAEVAGSFSKGRSRLSVVAGNGNAFNDTYFVIGAGAAYYLTDGLNVGLDLEWWTGGDPGIVKVSPSVQYVFYQIPRVAPYVGAFYRRSYVNDLDDIDSVGGRAGAYVSAGRNTYFGLGVVYESYLDCDDSRYVSCSEWYPEVSVTVAF